MSSTSPWTVTSSSAARTGSAESTVSPASARISERVVAFIENLLGRRVGAPPAIVTRIACTCPHRCAGGLGESGGTSRKVDSEAESEAEVEALVVGGARNALQRDRVQPHQEGAVTDGEHLIGGLDLGGPKILADVLVRHAPESEDELRRFPEDVAQGEVGLDD